MVPPSDRPPIFAVGKKLRPNVGDWKKKPSAKHLPFARVMLRRESWGSLGGEHCASGAGCDSGQSSLGSWLAMCKPVSADDNRDEASGLSDRG